ncbi:DUF2085 domain-containing protein [Methanoculleus sp. 10]|uniref:DUF2085 domain-containing protein n=1 Tax=Methanoculleus sp. 10 TaxID=430615 RepID=UPI003423D02A
MYLTSTQANATAAINVPTIPGIWLGYLLGASIFTLNFRISPQVSIFMLFPMLMDGFSQNFGFRESNNILRIITGILFGTGFASFMLAAIVYGI